jgi:hypothetical protein
MPLANQRNCYAAVAEYLAWRQRGCAYGSGERRLSSRAGIIYPGTSLKRGILRQTVLRRITGGGRVARQGLTQGLANQSSGSAWAVQSAFLIQEAV